MKETVQKILIWYDKYKRDFPWRYTKDPYKVMIAEFMLHRTKADQVVPIFLNFIKKFPDVHSLAEADPEEIKRITEHLGLHWRSKQFIEASKYLIQNFEGKFPVSYNNLRKIPGIGSYTAGVILTVCFNKPAPVVDSNIGRFINRYYGLNLIGEIRRKNEITKIAGELFSCNNPGKFLFALVDFSSLVCKPQKPLCDKCRLNNSCNLYNELI